MKLIDFAYSLITGQYRLDRQMAAENMRFLSATQERRELIYRGNRMFADLEDRRMKLYAGAEPGTERPMPNILSTPEDYRQAFERYVLMRGARQMEEDYGFFDGLLDDFETYVVGDSLVYLPDTGNPDANRIIREYVEICMDQADLSKRLDLTKIAQLFVRTMKRDGECGAMPIDMGDSIMLHYVSGDSIGNPLVGANVGPNNYNGIISDPVTGEIVLYRLYKRIPKLNAYFFDREVPASQFWHYHEPFRLDQYHGVTIFKTAIRDAFDIDQIINWSKLNMKWRASQLPVIHTETGRPRGAGVGWWPGYGAGAGASNPNGQPVNSVGVPQPMSIQVDGVVTNYLKTDEAIVDFPHDFPNAQLKVTIEELRRECAKGAHLPYEFAYRADNGGVVQRFWVNKAERTFSKDKHWLRRVLLNPFIRRNIQKGIDTGFLDLSAFGNLAQSIRRFKGTWQMGRAISVDYKNETAADINQIDSGLMSPQDFCAENGRDLETVRREISDHATWILAEAQKIAKKLDLDPAFVVPFLVKKFPNPGAALKAEAADIDQPDTPPGSLSATDREMVDVG